MTSNPPKPGHTMPSRHRAIAAAVIALLVIVASVAGMTGFFLLESPQSNSIGSSANGLRVVNENVTVHGKPAFIGLCEATAAWCPTSEMNMSLSVELISYNNTYYYVHTGTVTHGGGALTVTRTNSTGGLSVTTYTPSQTVINFITWFTNSTLYCVTPNMNTAPICPA